MHNPQNLPEPSEPPSPANPGGTTVRFEIAPRPLPYPAQGKAKFLYNSKTQPIPLGEEAHETAAPLGGIHFHHLLQNIYDAVLITECNGAILLSNLRADKFFAAKPGNLKHFNVVGLIRGANASLLPTILEAAKENRFVLMQAYCRRLDGTSFPAEISVNQLDLSGKDCLSFFVRDITERKKTEDALQQATLELTEKNAELARFLYSASHDLKSPLVTAKTFLGFLEQDLEAGDSARIKKDIHFIATSTDKMARLLEELLEMSRIGRVVNSPENVSFRSLVDEALHAVAGRLAKGGVKVTVNECDLMLRGDKPRLAEIWQNLVDNACKFMGSQKEPRIEIGAETHGEETRFFVRDNGVGIDPLYHSKVFGLFEKLDAQAEGTGIGLAHVKRIVEVHGGRIWVESAGVGQGANFLFILPGTLQIAQNL